MQTDVAGAAAWQVHTRQEAADALKVPVGQIDAAIQRGELEAFRVGKHLRITDVALRKFAGLDEAA